MSFSGIGGTVLLACGIEVGAGGHASVGVVSELVHVESVLSSGQARNLASHFDGARLGL